MEKTVFQHEQHFSAVSLASWCLLPKRRKLVNASALFFWKHRSSANEILQLQSIYRPPLCFAERVRSHCPKGSCLLYIDCRSAFHDSALWFCGLINLVCKHICETCAYVCVCVQHFTQCRLSVPDAGSDWSSGLWKERAGPQTVSGFQWILCLWVSVTRVTLGHSLCPHHRK